MSRNTKIILAIIACSILLFVPFIGRLHLFDWDEINFAESAREMLITRDYLTVQIFFEPFWEKPPLFIWFQAVSMHMFGVNEFAARFPNAIAGIITLVVLYLLGKRLVNERFGIIWTVAYGASLLPFLYFKSGIIDPWFNLFIFLGLAFYIFAQQGTVNKNKYGSIVLSASFIGLAVLTKGPAAILIFGLTAAILLFFSKFKLNLRFGHVAIYILVLSLVGGFWFILQILNGHWDTVVEFIVYQIRLFKTEDAGHGGFPLYHFVVLFFGVFPAAAFAIHGHKKNKLFSHDVSYFHKATLILFWVVLILFSIVKTKIVHYSSLCYFPLSFLAAYSVYAFIVEKKKVPNWLLITQLVTASLFALGVILLPVFDKYKQWFIDTGKVTHSFTIGNLQANPGWVGWEWLIGVFFLVGVVYSIYWIRKGFLTKGFQLFAISSTLFIYLAIVFITPKVEKYSQNSAIEFMKSMRDKDVYLGTLYKSYAMLFYTDAQPAENKNALKIDWQLTGDIDKPAYFVVRIDKLNENLNRYSDLEIVGEKNGYVFLKRSPVTNK
jgi:4-amino-4-deoxy-L-arabinose transferase-like glycosyltransferase